MCLEDEAGDLAALEPEHVLAALHAAGELRHAFDDEAIRRHHAPGVALAVVEEHVGPHEDVGVVLKPLVQDFPDVDHLFQMGREFRRGLAV